jgi:hypothetical protein
MIDPAFYDWCREFQTMPIEFPIYPGFHELAALLDDGRKWNEFLNELIKRAKTDSAFLTDARSKAEEIYGRCQKLENVTYDLWPPDSYTFALTAEMLRFTFAKDAERFLLGLSSDEFERINNSCKEHGIGWDEYLALLSSEQSRLECKRLGRLIGS